MHPRTPSPTGLLTVIVGFAALLLVALDRFSLVPVLAPIADTLYGWLLPLGAAGLLLGALNLLGVHLQRILAGASGWGHSLALVAAAVAVFTAGILNPDGAASPLVEWLFDALIAPGQATLFALLAFFMAAAAFRFIRLGRPGGGWLLAGALTMLLGQLPAVGGLALPPAFASFAAWALELPAAAAMRGAILGSSLALLLVGGRLLLRGE